MTTQPTPRFAVGDRVVAVVDITVGMLAPGVGDSERVRIFKGEYGTISAIYEWQRFDYRVLFADGWKWDVKVDWLSPAPADPPARDVIAELRKLTDEIEITMSRIAVLERRVAAFDDLATPAYERAAAEAREDGGAK